MNVFAKRATRRHKMVEKTLPLPEDALVSMLKSLPEDVLVDVFWKALIENDVSSLTVEEKKIC